MKRIGRILTLTLVAIYALSGIALIVFLVPATGFKAKTVATGSMRPAIPAGSLAIIQRVDATSIKTGDVITYKSPARTSETITHRVVRTFNKSGVPYVITKGDANTVEDPEVVGGLIEGRVLVHLPYLGNLIDVLRTPAGVIIIVLLPGAYIIYDEIRRLNRALRRSSITAPAPAVAEPPAADSTPNVQVEQHEPVPSSTPTAQRNRPRRTLDGMGPRGHVVGGVLVVAAVVFGSATTLAAMHTNTVTLADISLKVMKASPSPSATPKPGSNCTTVVISGTGPGSKNIVKCTNTSVVNIVNNNHVTVTNSNQQSATTGSVTGGGTSGSASNANATSTGVAVTTSPSPTPQP